MSIAKITFMIIAWILILSTQSKIRANTLFPDMICSEKIIEGPIKIHSIVVRGKPSPVDDAGNTILCKGRKRNCAIVSNEGTITVLRILWGGEEPDEETEDIRIESYELVEIEEDTQIIYMPIE